MADYERYPRSYDYERSRRYRRDAGFDDRRLDDRDSFGPTGEGYRTGGRNYSRGYETYGRDRDDYDNRYGQEERSFQRDPDRSSRYYGEGDSAARRSAYRSEHDAGRHRPQPFTGGYRGYAATYLDDNPGTAFTAPDYAGDSYAPPSRFAADERYRQAAGYRYGGSDGHRGFWEKAADEVSSWLGDEAANQRREMDGSYHQSHRGKGPKGYKRSDERIREDISDRLSDDHWLDASDIEVKVDGCEVTLSGHVPNRDDKRRAEVLAESISGVTHVQNNLRVSSGVRGSEAIGAASGMGLSGTVLADQAAGKTRGTA